MNTSMASIPNKSTILRFRHLLEAHVPPPQMMNCVYTKLDACCLLLKTGLVVGATWMATLSFTESSREERDPTMHQAKKGKR